MSEPERPNGLALGFALAGWFLLALAGPLSLFLTWFGDCGADVCPGASDVDRAIYLVDLVGWLAFPGVAFFASKGRRWAWVAVVVLGVAVLAQAAVSFAGASGFAAFGIVLVPGLLLGIGGLLGLVAPGLSAEGGASSGASELVGLGSIALVVTVLAFQGVAAGVGGPFAGLLILVAVIVVFIFVLAAVNRGRRRR